MKFTFWSQLHHNAVKKLDICFFPQFTFHRFITLLWKSDGNVTSWYWYFLWFENSRLAVLLNDEWRNCHWSKKTDNLNGPINITWLFFGCLVDQACIAHNVLKNDSYLSKSTNIWLINNPNNLNNQKLVVVGNKSRLVWNRFFRASQPMFFRDFALKWYFLRLNYYQKFGCFEKVNLAIFGKILTLFWLSGFFGVGNTFFFRKLR